MHNGRIQPALSYFNKNWSFYNERDNNAKYLVILITEHALAKDKGSQYDPYRVAEVILEWSVQLHVYNGYKEALHCYTCGTCSQ